MGFLNNVFSQAGKEKDPVCGMAVTKENNLHHADFEGTTRYFCSDSCQKQFEADPKNFVNKTGNGSCC